MLRIERYSKSNQTIWDHFVRTAKNATFLFERDFMEYHAERFVDHSVLIWEGESLLAIFPANESESIVWSHQGLSYGGMILQSTIDLPSVLRCFESLRKYYHVKGFTEIIYKSLPSIYCQPPSFEEEYALFRLGAERIRVEVNSVIDFKSEIAYARDRKRMIQLAQKNRLRIEQEPDVAHFWPEILIPTRWETHQVIPAHTQAEIERLMKLFPSNIQHYNVYKEKDLIGGGTIFITDRVIHTQYIASNADGKKMGAADFLVDHLIQSFKTTHQSLSFGISTDHHGQRLNEGLLYWKNGFGATVLPHYTYRIVL